MDVQAENLDEPKVFNVLQIIALDVVATGALFGAALVSGASLMTALLGGWIGGTIVTMGTVMAATQLRTWSEQRGRAHTAAPKEAPAGPELVSEEISDPMQLWEADLLKEIDYTVARKSDAAKDRKPRPAPPVTMVPMWDADAQEDADAARVAPKRAIRVERRQRDVPYNGPERRAANR
jgi:hypothetical protein